MTLVFLASHRDAEVVIDSLQEAQNSIQEYQRKWKVKVNPAKSQAIFFTRRRSPRFLPQSLVSCNGVDIPWSPNVDYLGVTLDQKLKFDCHVTNCLKKCDKLTRMLYPLVRRALAWIPTSKSCCTKPFFGLRFRMGFQLGTTAPTLTGRKYKLSRTACSK